MKQKYKERENYIVKQSEQITDGLKKVANQKKEAVFSNKLIAASLFVVFNTITGYKMSLYLSKSRHLNKI